MTDCSRLGGRQLRRRSRWRTARERGQAFAELALLLPFLVVMLTAAVSMGRAYHIKQTVAAATHAGIIYALQGKASAQNHDGILREVMNELGEIGEEITPVVDIAFGAPDGDGFGKQELSVTVQLTVPALLALPGFPSSYTVTERAYARVLGIEAKS